MHKQYYTAHLGTHLAPLSGQSNSLPLDFRNTGNCDLHLKQQQRFHFLHVHASLPHAVVYLMVYISASELV